MRFFWFWVIFCGLVNQAVRADSNSSGLCEGSAQRSDSSFLFEQNIVYKQNKLSLVGRTEFEAAVGVGWSADAQAQIWRLPKESVSSLASDLPVLPTIREQPNFYSCSTEATINALRFLALNNTKRAYMPPHVAAEVLQDFPNPRDDDSYNLERVSAIHQSQYGKHRHVLGFWFNYLWAGLFALPDYEDRISQYLSGLGLKARASQDAKEIARHLKLGYPAIVMGGISRTGAFYQYGHAGTGQMQIRKGIAPGYGDQQARDSRSGGNHAIFVARPVQAQAGQTSAQVLALDSADALYKVYSLPVLLAPHSLFGAVLIEPLPTLTTQD